MKENKKRDIRYDFLRALCVGAIIGVHCLPAQAITTRQVWFHWIVAPVLLSAVGIYFMLSGLFLLQSPPKSIGEFYKKRIKAIIVPFALYGAVYFIVWAVKAEEKISVWKYIRLFFTELISGELPEASHMRFMYALFGLYLCTPFLSRMTCAMKDVELKWLLGIVIGVQAMITLGENLGFSVQTVFQYVIFSGWCIYYILGYGLRRLCAKKDYKVFILLGAAGLLITVAQKRLELGTGANIHDLSPAMMAIGAAIFLTFEFYGEVKNNYVKKAVSWISKYSYSIYLIHFLLLQQFVRPIVFPELENQHYFWGTGLRAAVTFLLSAGFAFIFDNTAVRGVRYVFSLAFPVGLPYNKNSD